ncbi:hypothetical protein FQA39_LY06383 [Lamprigera yunnana]|nr:hypothetical protein FQA39_LY06383 [Lamprigera yunnana]
MEMYTKYKDQLKDLQYPNVNALNDEEIKDIFTPQNRHLFLLWLVSNLNCNVASETSDSAIADYIHETGFCKSSQKQLFVQGNCSLEEDIQIFDRILNYLYLAQEAKGTDYLESSSQSRLSIDDFLKKDINILPHLPTSRIYSKEERGKRLSSYEKNVEHLKQLLMNTHNYEYTKFDAHDSFFDEENISSNMKAVKEHAKFLNRVVSRNAENTAQSSREDCNFGPNFEKDLEKCCSELGSVLQYFKNINLVKFINDKSEKRSSKEDYDIVDVLKHISENLSNIMKVSSELANSIE